VSHAELIYSYNHIMCIWF